MACLQTLCPGDKLIQVLSIYNWFAQPIMNSSSLLPSLLTSSLPPHFFPPSSLHPSLPSSHLSSLLTSSLPPHFIPPYLPHTFPPFSLLPSLLTSSLPSHFFPPYLPHTFPPQCTPYTQMSEDSLLFSFAKFLELRFYGGSYVTRYHSDGTSDCPHLIHKDYIQHFCCKNSIASFQ